MYVYGYEFFSPKKHYFALVIKQNTKKVQPLRFTRPYSSLSNEFYCHFFWHSTLLHVIIWQIKFVSYKTILWQNLWNWCFIYWNSFVAMSIKWNSYALLLHVVRLWYHFQPAGYRSELIKPCVMTQTMILCGKWICQAI